MSTPRTQTSPAAVAAEVTTLSAGLGILSIQLFPFAIPGLVLVFGPLIPVALALAVLEIPFAAPIWLARAIRRRSSRGRRAMAGAAAART